jgi:hypothetical protein
VPKNLLYLTDRLPKPNYVESPKKNQVTSSLVIKSNTKDEIEKISLEPHQKSVDKQRKPRPPSGKDERVSQN